jgi:hypothetical protein
LLARANQMPARKEALLHHQRFFQERRKPMSLTSWGGPDGLLSMLPEGTFEEAIYAHAFYEAFKRQIKKEKNRQGKRSNGDRQAFSDCIKEGMAAAIRVLKQNYPLIEEAPEYGINIEGLPQLKKADYAFRNQGRFYVIEQKSVLSFNDFAAASLEGLLAKRQDKGNVCIVALFSATKQKVSAFQSLCSVDGLQMLDRLFVLCPEKKFSVKEVECMFLDIVDWLIA